MTHGAIIVMSHLQMLVFWLKFSAITFVVCSAILYYMKHTKNRHVLAFFDLDTKEDKQ